MGDLFRQNDKEVEKKNRIAVIKGVLIRIICSCLIFLLLFVAQRFQIEIANYTTDRVLEEISDNTLVDTIEEKISDIFH